MKHKKRNIWPIILAVLLFSYSIVLYNWNHTGSKSGTVIDADTGKPIEGAVVCMQWFAPGFLGVTRGNGEAFYETLTDSNGRYFVPNQRFYDFQWFSNVKNEKVLIYKDGYSACEVDEYGKVFMFGVKGFEKTYSSKNAFLKMYRLIGYSHSDHIFSIERYGIYNWPKRLIEKELEAERKRASNERHK